VQFVPLIGAEGWSEREGEVLLAGGRRRGALATAELIREVAEPFPDIEEVELGPLLDRVGNARVVLLGEATHGTSEFYRMRARITRELVERFGFTIVAVEADWPDAARVDHYVRHTPFSTGAEKAFSRFPVWMWRNQEVHDFVEWLRDHNERIDHPEARVGFYGLDLYSLTSSSDEYVWFGETRAVRPLAVTSTAGIPETYPFGV
jgi:protein-L-isoaspartate(D-aspartate) O-methyltransferase